VSETQSGSWTRDHKLQLVGIIVAIIGVMAPIVVAFPSLVGLQPRAESGSGPPGPSNTDSTTEGPTTSPPPSPPPPTSPTPERTSEPAPPRSPRPTPTPKPKPPASDVPSAYVGQWHGRGQNIADPYIDFTVDLDIRRGKVGAVVGAATVAGKINCQFDLELVAVHAEGLEIWANDQYACIGSDVALVLNGEALEYGGRNQGDPQYWMTATLYRQS
jgi:hypothetical protein